VRWVWGIFLLAGAVFANCFVEAGQYYGVNPWLLYAIAKTESGLNPYAVEVISRKKLPLSCPYRYKRGKYYYSCFPQNYYEALRIVRIAQKHNANFSIGLMQVNKVWLKEISKYGYGIENLFNWCNNVKIGAWILARCISEYGNSWKAVDCYNKGIRGARGWSHYTILVRKNLK